VGDFLFPANITVPDGGLLLVVPTDPATVTNGKTPTMIDLRQCRPSPPPHAHARL